MSNDIDINTYVRLTFEFLDDKDISELYPCDEDSKTWILKQSVQKYNGQIKRGCLHGDGTYMWQFDNKKFAYNGKFFINSAEGYGKYSFPNGCLFEGLMKGNKRFGPGVHTQFDGLQDVGLWVGRMLIRLIQKVDSGVPKLATSRDAKVYLLRFRKLVAIPQNFHDIAKAILYDIGANDNFIKRSSILYLHSARDPRSLFLDHQFFYEKFHHDDGQQEVYMELEPSSSNNSQAEEEKQVETFEDSLLPVTHLVAWNNEDVMVEILKHVFRHRMFESNMPFSIGKLLKCKRKRFSSEGPHESLCIEMLKACRKGERKRVQEILAYGGVNPNVSDCDGNSGLMIATAQDAYMTMEVLLNAGANVNCLNDDGFTPLSLSLTRFLAATHDVKNWEEAFTPPELQTMSNFGAVEPYQWRCRRPRGRRKTDNISEPSNIEGKSKYIFCLEKKLPPPVKKTKRAKKAKVKKKIPAAAVVPTADEIFEMVDKFTTLATIKKTIKKLLRRGADPNFCEVPLPPLFLAIFSKDPEIVDNLLYTGADPNIKNISTGRELTPLHIVVQYEPCTEMVNICEKLLIHNAYADITIEKEPEIEELTESEDTKEVTSKGKTPLHVLCLRQDFSEENAKYLNAIAKLLILKGHADANALFHGCTPLGCAIQRGNAEMVRTLLETKQVDPNKNVSLETGLPLSLLVTQKLMKDIPIENRKHIAEHLLSYGADPLENVKIGDEFEGNILEYVSFQNEAPLVKPKKVKKPSKKEVEEKKEYMELVAMLREDAQNRLTKHIQGNIVRALLHNVKSDKHLDTYKIANEELTLDIMLDSFTLTPEEAMYCLEIMASKKRIFVEEVVELLQIIEPDDAKKVMKLVGNKLNVFPHKKPRYKQRTKRALSVKEEIKSEYKEMMGTNLSSKDDLFPTLMYAASNIGKTLLPPEVDTEKEVDSDGILSFSFGQCIPGDSEPVMEKISMSRLKAITSLRQTLHFQIKQLSIAEGEEHKEKCTERVDLVATRSIIRQPKFFAVNPVVDRKKDKYEVCYECGQKRNKQLIRCPDCKLVKFCSEECNKKNINRETHHQCGTISYGEEKRLLERQEREKAEREAQTAIVKSRSGTKGTSSDELTTIDRKTGKKGTTVIGSKTDIEEFGAKGLKKKGSKKDKLGDKVPSKKGHKGSESGDKVSRKKGGKEAENEDSKEGKNKKIYKKGKQKGKNGYQILPEDTSHEKKKVRGAKQIKEGETLEPSKYVSVALFTTCGSDDLLEREGLSFPNVVLRDECLYYHLRSRTVEFCENYSLN